MIAGSFVSMQLAAPTLLFGSNNPECILYSVNLKLVPFLYTVLIRSEFVKVALKARNLGIQASV